LEKKLARRVFQYLPSQTLILLFIKHHDRKEVRKAARKAKTFETQKILKKIKDARCVLGSAISW
jgi:primosomal protein N'